MNKGKNICNELKAVRRRIADENGIPLDVKECTYHGPCAGTCPRCEAEVQYLESELEKRIQRTSMEIQKYEKRLKSENYE